MPKNQNEFSKISENNANIFVRFYLYQKERFPVLLHGILIASFSFSAIAYSCICTQKKHFVSLNTYFMGVFMAMSLFLLLRISDEHKDNDDDILFRKSLPVPRGLVSLAELFYLGVGIIFLQIILQILFFPKMLYLYVFVMGYLYLMGKEFFVKNWLKKNQFFYVISHIAIIPIVDIYVSGLDWFLDIKNMPFGLFFFFLVSYFNGLVLEIGRKIRIPSQEAEGVLTYSAMLGMKNAIFLWIFVLFMTFGCAIGASIFAGLGNISLWILGCIFLLCLLPAFLLLSKKNAFWAKILELCSLIWTIAMYLILGGMQMFVI